MKMSDLRYFYIIFAIYYCISYTNTVKLAVINIL